LRRQDESGIIAIGNGVKNLTEIATCNGERAAPAASMTACVLDRRRVDFVLGGPDS
jgi:hypothetical protein